MLSTTAEYALRIIIALTERANGPMTSESIAQVTQVPPDYAVKVLQMLGRARLVKAQRGRGGGFQLACDPRTTSMLDVVSVIDPVRRIDSCPLGRQEHEGQLCPLHQRIDDIAALLESSLASMTIQSVVDESAGSALCQPTEAEVSAGRRRGKKTTKAARAASGQRAKDRHKVR